MYKKKLLLLQLILATLISCNKDKSDIDYKEEMREFVIGISEYAKAEKPSFIVIPQNGIELVTKDGDDFGSIHTTYLDAIDGHGQEDLFYGYDNDNEETPSRENYYLERFLDKSKNTGNVILVTDYCSTPSKMNESYYQNNQEGYISFAADERELNSIPTHPIPIYNENDSTITSLVEVRNFLYLINPENFATKTDFIVAITSTNYDLLIMDLFFNDNSEFTQAEIESLRNKTNGGKRLIVSYMSIGEAEDYRYYWQSDWNKNEPSWIEAENPDWEGNFKVKYWNEEWQNIIYGSNDAYLDKIINAGFDGVYLDIIDAFEYFE